MYSTDSGSHRKSKETKASKPNQKGPVKIRLEKAGRGGKIVTVLFNLPFSDSQAQSFMKEMQNRFGCGATFKGAQIEVRGDLRDRIEDFFKEKNIVTQRAGG